MASRQTRPSASGGPTLQRQTIAPPDPEALRANFCARIRLPSSATVPPAALPAAVATLPQEDRHALLLDAGEGARQALRLVHHADLRLHRRRLPERGEKVVRSHRLVDLRALGDVDIGLPQYPFPRIQAEHRISDPRLLPLLALRHHK